MIQDIAPHTFANHYDPDARPDPEEPVLVINAEKLLCRILSEKEKQQDPLAFSGEEQIHDGTGRQLAAAKQTAMEFATWAQVQQWLPGIKEEDITYIFTIDTTDYFLLDVTPDPRKDAASQPSSDSRMGAISIPDDYAFYTLNDLREKDVGPKVREFAAMTAMHLAHWYRNNRFCGRCGSRTVKDTVERALTCPCCGNKIYPRIVPAVIVGVVNPRTNKILLTKYRRGYSHYALVAGFTEIGESLEGTVRREVMEETGLRVKNIRYYKSQPWGIVDDILAGFFCEVDGDDTIHMEEDELKVAAWFAPEEVELQPQDFSLTNEMMYRFQSGQCQGSASTIF